LNSYADNYTLEKEMIACAEWLGRDHTTCTRKPDGCACEPKEPVCTCSDGPYHYRSCPMYKEGHDPFAALGKAMHTAITDQDMKGVCDEVAKK